MSPLMMIFGATPAKYSAMPSSRRSVKMPEGVPSGSTDAPSTTMASALPMPAFSAVTIDPFEPTMVTTFVMANTATTATTTASTISSTRLRHPLCFFELLIGNRQ